ncbi:MAG: terminase small subunit [Oscillospiraceae bacterium]
MKKDFLKPKEILFCQYFVKLQNCKEAAIKAGYSPLVAERTSQNLLKSQAIQSEIGRLCNSYVNNDLFSCALAGLKRLAFTCSNDSLKLLKGEISDDLDLFHISEIKIKDGAIEIKYFDRFKALDMLLKIAKESLEKNDENDFFKALEFSADNNDTENFKDGEQ